MSGDEAGSFLANLAWRRRCRGGPLRRRGRLTKPLRVPGGRLRRNPQPFSRTTLVIADPDARSLQIE